MLLPQELLGMWLRDRRKSLGLTQEQIAALVGIDDARVSRLENGQQMPTLPELPLLARALKVDVIAILQAFGMETAPVDFTRLDHVLVRALRELDDRGLEVLAYTARGLLPLQSEEPEPPPPEGQPPGSP